MAFESEISKAQPEPAGSPGSKLFEETMAAVPGCTNGKQSNQDYIEKMSTAVANALEKNTYPGDPRPGKLLSEALKPLTSNEDRNELLKETKEKNEESAQKSPELAKGPSMQHLLLNKWNAKTGTWDDVTIADYQFPLSSASRIVQPGNTLGSLASDRLTQVFDYTHHIGHPDQAGQHRPWDWKYAPSDVVGAMGQIAKLNGLGDPNKKAIDLKQGDAIRLPGVLITLQA